MSDKIREALAGMLAIVDESRGVDGYHLNGDTAEWDEFPEVEAARAALAQQPAPVAQEPVAWMRCDEYPSVTVSGAVLEDWRRQRVVIRPLYVAPPAAEQPEDGYPPCDYCAAEVDYMPWHGSGPINGVESRHIHACNNCRNLLPGREQPNTVRVSVETLQHIHRDLDSCQKVIWLAGCHPFGYGFDPAYVTEAQARLKEIDALLAGGAA